MRLVKIWQINFLCHVCLWFCLYDGTVGDLIMNNSQDKVFQRKLPGIIVTWRLQAGLPSWERASHSLITHSWFCALKNNLFFTLCSFLAEFPIVLIKRDFFFFCYLYYNRTAGSRVEMNPLFGWWSLYFKLICVWIEEGTYCSRDILAFKWGEMSDPRTSLNQLNTWDLREHFIFSVPRIISS